MSFKHQFVNQYDFQDATVLSDRKNITALINCLNGKTNMLIFTNVFKIAKTPDDFIKRQLVPVVKSILREQGYDGEQAKFTTGPTVSKFKRLKGDYQSIVMENQTMKCASKVQFFISPGCFGYPKTFTVQIVSDQSAQPKSIVILRCDIKYPNEPS